MSYQHFGIVGGGAWGTALAEAAARAGRQVTLWAREAEVVAAINETHVNQPFLPGAPLNPAIRATGELNEMAAADAILLVTPAQHAGRVAGDLAAHLAPDTPVIIAAKGIELATGRLLGEAVGEALPGHPLAVLSGPTFAIEAARGQPTALTLASADERLGHALIAALGSPAFRPYLSHDLIGVQIGGAVKNVIAIAAGITDGLGLGDNARAALITRGLAEMARLGTAMGARGETFMGLSGLGDLTLTCSSTQSRNYSLGHALGQGKQAGEVLGQRSSVTEGVKTATATAKLAQRLGIDMPITEAIHAVLEQGADLQATLTALMARPLKAERD